MIPLSRRVCRLRLRLRPLRRLITRLRFCRRQRQQCRHLRRPLRHSRRQSVISKLVVVITVIFNSVSNHADVVVAHRFGLETALISAVAE